MHHGPDLFNHVVLLSHLLLVLVIVVAAAVVLIEVLHASVGTNPVPRLGFVLASCLFKIGANILLAILLHLESLTAARLLVLTGAALRVSTFLLNDELLARVCVDLLGHQVLLVLTLGDLDRYVLHLLLGLIFFKALLGLVTVQLRVRSALWHISALARTLRWGLANL